MFRSTALMDVEAGLRDKTLTITGGVHDVDFAKVNAADAGAWELDPTGGPRGNARVDLAVTEQIRTRTQVGTAYDFITKTTSPVYDYGERHVSLGTRTITTVADGTFRVPMSVHGGDRTYEVTATYADEAGRVITAQTYGFNLPSDDTESMRLVVPGHAYDEPPAYRIGDRVTAEALGGYPAAATDRYLFTVTHIGLSRAEVQDGPMFGATFPSSWIPDAYIRAVRFNGTTYEASDALEASYDVSQRALQVSLTADASRYEPGGRAKVAIRTLDASGRPVSASVIVRVVDEKLYAIGGAQDVDVLSELYAPVSGGVIGISWSHGMPAMHGGEGGDTTGGGGDERDDFRDWLLFQRVTTGADGRATVTVDLSDDLTSWRVSAAAVDTAYQAGGTTMSLPVGLPFFAEAALAQEYLVGDQPVLRLRGYGSALGAGDTVSYAVSSSTLGLNGSSASAKAFTAASVALPALTAGDHGIRIVASTGSGANHHEDVLIRTIHVVASRSVQAHTASGLLVAGFRLQGGKAGQTTVVLSDGGRGRAVPVLTGLLGAESGRADELLASALAQRTLHEMFGVPERDLPANEADIGAFRTGGGLALLPYGSPDLELSALAALANDPRVEPDSLRQLFVFVRFEDDSTRERRIVALAGLAALGDPVLADVRTAAKASKLTTIERSWLAVAALAAGDETLAGTLERAVLAKAGQRLGPWVRVRDGGSETTATTTAVLAIAAAGIGDPVAADMDAFLEANSPRDTLLDLQRAIAARSWAERTPGQAAVASMRVDGTTRRVEVSAAEPTWITLTPAQVASASITPVSGSVLVTTRWEAPLDAASLHRDGVTTFTRTVDPTGTVPIDGLVTVEFTVELAGGLDQGCWQVTDLVPSGLAPVWSGSNWYRNQDEDEESGVAVTVGPWSIQGQRVDFCVARDPRQPVQHLRYVARVVTPGTYRWEPSVIQSSIVLEHGMVLPARELVIAK